MSHKTLIGGTAYNITGGKTLVNGTGYSIKSGTTLVNGTAYSINFGADVSPVLNDNDWATISEVSQSGQASNYWSVGDTKEIVIDGMVGQTTFSNLSIWAFIVGFDHNAAIEGYNTIHFQIGKSAQTNGKSLCLIDSQYNSNVSNTSGYFNMNYVYSNQGGWKSSQMRTVLLGNNNTPISPLSGSLTAALPSELRSVMKSVKKYSDNTGGGSDTASYVTSTTDYLWMLAEYEVYGLRKYANSAEQNYQAQYDYYANGNSKVFYRHSQTTSTANWCMRSAHANGGNSSGFCYVTVGGGSRNGSAITSSGLAPAFCV